MPGHAVLDHLQIDVPLAEVHLSQDAVVTVLFLPNDDNLFLADFLAEGLFASGSERLLFLRRIDSLEPNLMLHFVRIQQPDRVAVGDADNLAADLVGKRLCREQECG